MQHHRKKTKNSPLPLRDSRIERQNRWILESEVCVPSFKVQEYREANDKRNCYDASWTRLLSREEKQNCNYFFCLQLNNFSLDTSIYLVNTKTRSWTILSKVLSIVPHSDHRLENNEEIVSLPLNFDQSRLTSFAILSLEIIGLEGNSIERAQVFSVDHSLAREKRWRFA